MTPQPRPTRLAPLLVIAGFLLVAAYVGGYCVLATRTWNGDGFLYVSFDARWLCTLYHPAAWADSMMYGHPACLCYPTSPTSLDCSIVNER